MKKHIAVFFFTSLSFFAYTQKSSYNIGVLLEVVTPELEPLLEKAKEQIKVVVGEDANIYFPAESTLLSNFDLEKAEQNYRQLLNNSTDIILAFGAINNIIVSKQTVYPKPTILFGAVNQDMMDVELSRMSSGVENFTYLIETESYLDDLSIFKELTDFTKVGIVVENVFMDILPFENTFARIFEKIDADYKLIPYETVNDIKSGLTDIDAVYLAGGFFLTNDQVQDLAATFIEKKLPSFTSTDIEDVENGLYATNQGKEDIEQFLRRIALTVEAYINGAKLSEMPVFIEHSPRLTINFNTALQVGIPIKFSLIATTDFVGDFKNPLSEIEYDLLSAIEQGLGQNLALNAGQKNISLSEQEVKSAKSSYLPNASATFNAAYVDPNLAEVSLGQNPEFSTTGNLLLKQTIFSPVINASVDIQEHLLKAQQESFSADQLDVVFDVANAYFTTLILKANTQIQLQNLYLTKTNLEIADQNFEAGQSGKSDVLRFTSEMAQNTQNMVQAINQLQQGFIGLNQVLNNSLDTEIDVADVVLGEGVF